jgi:uncharacterized RDD family membrane protein YckC
MTLIGFSIARSTGIDEFSTATYSIIICIRTAIEFGYGVFFLGRFGATPGKMALGMKVVRADGTNISYLRAFGRCIAEYFSAIPFCAGYLMVLFDEEHRTLHDRICDTRVIAGGDARFLTSE